MKNKGNFKENKGNKGVLGIKGEIKETMGTLELPLGLDNIGKKCWVPFIYTLWLLLNWLTQSKMLKPLGIKVLSLHIQTKSLLSLGEFNLGISFGNLSYSNICIVIFGSNWSMWLWKCLATVVLLLCLMSKMWPWNLSMILFLVCPTYLMWHQLHSRQYIRWLLLQVPFSTILAGFGLLHPLIRVVVGWVIFSPNKHVLEVRWLPIGDHEVLFCQFSGGIRPA